MIACKPVRPQAWGSTWGMRASPAYSGSNGREFNIRALTAQPAKTGVNALTFFAGYVK
jgi:hypothetical protein